MSTFHGLELGALAVLGIGAGALTYAVWRAPRRARALPSLLGEVDPAPLDPGPAILRGLRGTVVRFGGATLILIGLMAAAWLHVSSREVVVVEPRHDSVTGHRLVQVGDASDGSVLVVNHTPRPLVVRESGMSSVMASRMTERIAPGESMAVPSVDYVGDYDSPDDLEGFMGSPTGGQYWITSW